ncbi:MAG TPA: ABC transporter ATP-binding protein, partial [Ilumatobacteraceae bacterium]|nr:ABC transporter ATP-binding protein [Ilumatobacteraceae bacterium]
SSYPTRPPVVALDDVSITVDSGQILAVLGPSGCGKTTLLRVIAGFERPDSGTVSFDGVPMAGTNVMVNPERRGVGIVPQEGGLFPHLDVAGNVAFGLRNLPRPERRRRVDELLDLVALPGLGGRRADELSGGQQQRVALARALARRPGIVLLDEPFAALDTGLRASLRDDVCAVLRATGTTAVLVTHDQAEALTTADQVAVMRSGRVIQHGSPQIIYQQPVDLAAAQFLGECTLVDGRMRSDCVETIFGRVQFVPHGPTAPVGQEATVMIRPEQIVPSPGSPTTAVVSAVRFEGPIVQLSLDICGCIAQARWPATAAVEVDDVVNLSVAGPVNVYPGQSVPG